LVQTLIIHPNNNRGTETQQSTSDFDVNGNLLTLDNIGTLNWHYNNTLGKLKKRLLFGWIMRVCCHVLLFA
jgi:hypothetical protein